MKIQRFEGLSTVNKVSSKHSNAQQQNCKFFDMDSVDSALKTDSIDDPILPQIVRKFKKAYDIIFPDNVVSEAQAIQNRIDGYVCGSKLNKIA